MDDDELIAALAAGDDTALRERFRRHAPWLAGRLRAALPPPDVEDVLQETFLPGQLSERGRAQAQQLGRWRLGDGITAVFSSDLARATQTASVAFAGSAIPLLYDCTCRAVGLYGVFGGGGGVGAAGRGAPDQDPWFRLR
jgi:hypothetical protein